MDSVWVHVVENTVCDCRKKYVQFATLLHLLQQSKPLIDYEHIYQPFLDFQSEEQPPPPLE